MCVRVSCVSYLYLKTESETPLLLSLKPPNPPINPPSHLAYLTSFFELPQPATLTVHPQITKLNDSRVTGQVPEYKIMLRHLYPIPDEIIPDTDTLVRVATGL